MKMTLAESTFQKVCIQMELAAVPRTGEFVDTTQGTFIVDKIVYRPEKSDFEQVLLLVSYK